MTGSLTLAISAASPARALDEPAAAYRQTPLADPARRSEEVPPPPYMPFRWLEDWSPPPGPAGARNPFKHIPLGAPGRYLSLGGELRAETFQYRDRVSWAPVSPSGDGVYRLRSLGYADLHLSSASRVFAEFEQSEEINRAGGSLPGEENVVDLNQAFADFRLGFVAAEPGRAPDRP